MGLARLNSWTTARLVLAIFVVAVGILSMPKLQYIGDPMAIRAAAAHWLNTGKPDVPSQVAESSGQRGQYYFQNPRNGRYYSKYGALNTVGYLPVLTLERSVTGHLPLYNETTARTLLLNAQNLALAVLIALILLEMARLYTDRPWLGMSWVLASLYASFGWNYLRAQTAEISQWLWASLFLYLVLRILRTSEVSVDASVSPTASVDPIDKSNTKLWVGAQLALGVLFLLKGVYVLWGCIWLLVLVDLRRSRAVGTSDDTRFPGGLWAWLPLGIGLALLLALNYYKFGDALASGYTQWERERHFFSGNVWQGMWGFLSDPAKSIFIYQPLLLVSLWGWRGFFRRWRRETLALLLAFITLFVLNSCTINWGGHWSYGPRYLLVVLTPLTLPALLVGERIIQGWQCLAVKLSALIVAVMLVVSLGLQTQVNALEYFTYYRVEAVLQACRAEQALDVLHRLPFGVVNYQLLRFKSEDVLPGFVQVASAEIEPDMVAPMQGQLLLLVRNNYYWQSD